MVTEIHTVLVVALRLRKICNGRCLCPPHKMASSSLVSSPGVVDLKLYAWTVLRIPPLRMASSSLAPSSRATDLKVDAWRVCESYDTYIFFSLLENFKKV